MQKLPTNVIINNSTMSISLFKGHFIFKVIILAFLVFLAVFADHEMTNAENHKMLALGSVSSTITDLRSVEGFGKASDAIDSFLFHISEDVRNKVMMLGEEPIEYLPIPILFGVSVGDFTDTWGEARASGRIHAGTDIIAHRGELVVSPTDAVVTKIGYDNKGGNFVITANPGGEQFYFAHLDRAAENLSVGDVLKSGDIIGYVGNTGNARGKSPHLHLGIYYKELSRNPFPRLIREFSIEEKIVALEQILTTNKIALGMRNSGVRFLQRFLINNSTGSRAKALAKAGATGYFGSLTKSALAEYQKASSISPSLGHFGPVTKANILTALNPNSVSAGQIARTSAEIIPEIETLYSLVIQINNDLGISSSGKEVVWLQDFLISAGTGPRARALANAGATRYFGILTKNALAEYQLSVGIHPASGYFGPITRASIKTLGGN